MFEKTFPLGAATDNAARYTVTSCPVPSTERNIFLAILMTFSMILQSENLGKFNDINNCLILAL